MVMRFQALILALTVLQVRASNETCAMPADNVTAQALPSETAKYVQCLKTGCEDINKAFVNRIAGINAPCLTIVVGLFGDCSVSFPNALNMLTKALNKTIDSAIATAVKDTVISDICCQQCKVKASYTTTVKTTVTTVVTTTKKPADKKNTTKKSGTMTGGNVVSKTTAAPPAAVTYTGSIALKTTATKKEIETAVQSAFAKKFKVDKTKITVTATSARRLSAEERHLATTSKTWNVAFTVIADTKTKVGIDKEIKAFKADTKTLTAAIVAEWYGSTKGLSVTTFAMAVKTDEPVTSDAYTLSGKVLVAFTLLASVFGLH